MSKSLLKTHFDEDFFCKGKCQFCDGNGNISVPEPKYYEALMFKHRVVADYNLRQKIIFAECIKFLEDTMGK